jgi:MiaB/RimO family radical SAM methylthiotransferase
LKERKNPSAKLVVCGCLPRINSNKLKQVYDGSTFGSDDMNGLCEALEIGNEDSDISAHQLLPRKEEVFEVRRNGTKPLELKSVFDPNAYIRRITFPYYRYLENKTNRMMPSDYYIKVSTGCLNYCAYCAVKLSRGDVRSRSVETIVSEFETGLKKGYKEFALIGTDLGSYGRDQGVDLATLLTELVSRKGDYKVKLRNINPRFLIEMLPNLEKCFESKKIVHMSSAAQSGSNRILALMKRYYKIEDYRSAIRTLQQKFPFVHFRTQLLVGFPGETNDDFLKSVELLDSLFFDFIELYKYSPRPNTEAAQLDDRVSEEIIKKRYNKLYVKALINMSKRRFLRSQ